MLKFDSLSGFQSPLLSQYTSVFHYFGTKLLNTKVIINNHSILDHRKIEIISPDQIHGDQIGWVNLSTINDEFRATDALISDQSMVLLTIKTADCVPILIYDTQNKVIAAIHSGWRSTVLNIVGKTVSRLKSQFNSKPKNLIAAIGPCIGPDNYEVGSEVVKQFEQEILLSNDVLNSKDCAPDKARLNLRKAIYLQLIDSGFTEKQIDSTDECTFTNSSQFYSARREGLQTGRMISGIMLLD